MSAITVDPAGVAEGGRSVPTGPIWLLRDTWAEATRHLIATWRNPDQIGRAHV